MRAVTLLLCLALAACATAPASAPGDQAAPATPAAGAAAPPAAAETPPAATPAPVRRGAAQAARGTSAPHVPAPEPEPELSPQERTMQIRVTCWAEVDKQAAIRRSIDARVAWVDKCIADKSKALPR